MGAHKRGSKVANNMTQKSSSQAPRLSKNNINKRLPCLVRQKYEILNEFSLFL